MKNNDKGMISRQIDADLLRQAGAKQLTVGITQLEIHRNKIPKKVKLIDVKLSFSYQEDYTTKTERLEKQLVRHGKKWSWPISAGGKSILTFPYAPGDRVNLNFGLVIHKTKKLNFFSSETITTEVGNVTECMVLAKNSGVGIALPLNTLISQHFRLNFNLNGYGHHMTLKLRLEQLDEGKANPSLWLRPSSVEKPFRTSRSILGILKDGESFPPRQKTCDDESVKSRSYICTNQRLVNYNRTAVIECWSIRPCTSQSDIPSGIQIRQVYNNKPVACLIPVVKNVQEGLSDNDQKVVDPKQLKLAILVMCPEGPYCLCSASWTSADKFVFKIHYYSNDEVHGQKIKWAARDFLDIGHIITNSTGHQYYFKPDTTKPLEDLCIGLSLKFLVRWNDETMPWKKEGSRPLSVHDVEPDVSFGYHSYDPSDFGNGCAINPLDEHMDTLPSFLESHNMALFQDIESKVSMSKFQMPEHDKSDHGSKQRLSRKGSGSSYGDSFHGIDRYIKNEKRDLRRSMKKKSAIESRMDSDSEKLTSGFVEDFAGNSGLGSRTGSFIESYIE